MKGIKGSESHRFDWDALVPLVVHPMRVQIIEALGWIGEPLSAANLTRIFDDADLSLSGVSYHVTTLAKAGVLVKVGQRPVRGSVEKFYFFAPV
jgi:DNA-binding transcriptional ArsR family regulator